MEFNYFKDWLFDLMNESDDNISNIITDDKNDSFIVTMKDGYIYGVRCQKIEN